MVKKWLFILFIMETVSLHAADSDSEDLHVSLKTKLFAALSKKKRRCAFFDAIKFHNEDTFQYLIEKYPDLTEASDEEGCTPLLRLLEIDQNPEHFWKKCLSILFSYEVNMNGSDLLNRWTPLLRAVNYKEVPLDLVESLVNRGADVNLSKDQDTPLMLAARNGRHDIICFLLDKGAKPALKNRWERTAADEARTKGYQDLADYIDFRAAQERVLG